MTDLWLSGAIFSTSKYSKTRFWPGLRPGPRWGSLRRSPRPPSRLGRGTPPHHSLPPRRLRRLGCQPPNTNFWLCLCLCRTRNRSLAAPLVPLRAIYTGEDTKMRNGRNIQEDRREVDYRKFSWKSAVLPSLGALSRLAAKGESRPIR